MPALKALWRPLASIDALQRSSHGVAVHGDKAFIFGGELMPRTPVDAIVTELNLLDGSTRTLPAQSSSASWPPSRVGATFVTSGDKLYLWGGRGGKAMDAHTGERGIWSFSPESGTWEELQTQGEQPEPRSFHTMVALNNTLYLHAGCPASGRLSQLHALDLATLTWLRLPDAPEPGRGGTVLTALPLASGGVLARFGGFAGRELDGLDVYDPATREWRAVDAQVEGGGEAGEGPAKRSVQAFVGLDGKLEWEGKRVVAVMAMGERESAPAELGHDGAGFFHSDAWALLATPSSPPSYSWAALPPSSASTQGTPEARGWLASARAGGTAAVLQGGLNARNERLSDAWLLEVMVE
ncbi:hypothetical protein JCM10450v2_004267 [Rhodotorula kratochvilovae]